jgi:hypothetical protein
MLGEIERRNSVMSIVNPIRAPLPPLSLRTGLIVRIGGSSQDVTVDPNFLPGSGNFLNLSSISANSSTKLAAVDALNSGPEGSAAQGVLGQSQNGEGVRGVSLNGGAGVTGISSAPAASAQPGVWGESQNGEGVHGVSHSPNAAGISGHNDKGGMGGFFDAKVVINSDANVSGTLTVGVDIVLSAGAADCAEEFDIGTTQEVQPGTVMILDQGESLRPSDRSYDKKVAGVVSGGGEYRPAMILDRRDSSGKRALIALVGKVYCKVDAQYGAVEVGDLLTTSPTLGHAMKASDPFLAFGAVIGKALRPLSCGQGLIPVLIALQ